MKNFFFALILVCFSAGAFAQKALDKNAGKLKIIKEQLEEKKKRLEEYISRQEELKQDMENLKKNEADKANKKSSLENSASRLQGNISEARLSYENLKKTYDTMLHDLSDESTALYLHNFTDSSYYGKDGLIRMTVIRNLIVNRSVLAKNLDSMSRNADSNIKKLSRRKEEILREKKGVEENLRKSRMKIGRARKELAENKKKYSALQKEIDSLNKSAENLTVLVKKLEKRSPYRKSVHIDYIGVERNSLPWPLRGKVIGKFGREYVEKLKTWIIRDGIRIEAAGGAEVHPVLEGKVIYSGAFRNYGNIVIVSHKQGFFTTYGLLSRISVNTGDNVGLSSVLGVVGADQQAVSGNAGGDVLYFEIRDGDEAVDPLKWLK